MYKWFIVMFLAGCVQSSSPRIDTEEESGEELDTKRDRRGSPPPSSWGPPPQPTRTPHPHTWQSNPPVPQATPTSPAAPQVPPAHSQPLYGLIANFKSSPIQARQPIIDSVLAQKFLARVRLREIEPGTTPIHRFAFADPAVLNLLNSRGVSVIYIPCVDSSRSFSTMTVGNVYILEARIISIRDYLLNRRGVVLQISSRNGKWWPAL